MAYLCHRANLAVSFRGRRRPGAAEESLQGTGAGRPAWLSFQCRSDHCPLSASRINPGDKMTSLGHWTPYPHPLKKSQGEIDLLPKLLIKILEMSNLVVNQSSSPLDG